jgi:membrane protease subunit (stomatin/prohibitin family)
MAGAATFSMVSSARRNRAERQAIEQQTQGQDVSAAPQDDMTAQLEQLNELKSKGIITQEEFDAKKKQILGL